MHNEWMSCCAFVLAGSVVVACADSPGETEVISELRGQHGRGAGGGAASGSGSGASSDAGTGRGSQATTDAGVRGDRGGGVRADGDGGSPSSSSTPPPPASPPPASPPAPQPPETGGTLSGPRNRARILYSGHSLTDNPFPDLVESIAKQKGDDINWNQQNIPGSPIRVRTRGMDTSSDHNWGGYSTGKNRTGDGLNIIAELRGPRTLGPGEQYDTLVITERHDLLAVVQWESTTSLLRHYHDQLLAGNPDGRTLFYHSWLNVDKDNPQPWIDHETKAAGAWECVASKVNLTLQADGRPPAVEVVPTGGAMVELVKKVIAGSVHGITGSTHERLDRIFKDSVHPTDLGWTFAAAVQYAAIFRKSPVGTAVTAPGADAQTITDLQTIAWNYVNAYYQQSNPSHKSMDTCRSIVPEVCETWFTLIGDRGKIEGCRSYFSSDTNDNPFRWPDPNLQVWPAP